MIHEESSSNLPSDATAEMPVDSGPQFGLIDVVEAFTSLRHEYRSQVKETRELASDLTQSTQRIAGLETVLTRLAQKAEASVIEPTQPSLRVAEALIEFDTQLSRAIEVAIAEDQLRRSRQSQQGETMDVRIAGLSRWRLWAARPVIKAFQQQLDEETDQSATVIDGLSILLTKLRQTLQEHQIERIETVGEAFDGETMKSIGQLRVDGIATGHVTEQLSPAYRHNGQILQFATVRVAP